MLSCLYSFNFMQAPERPQLRVSRLSESFERVGGSAGLRPLLAVKAHLFNEWKAHEREQPSPHAPKRVSHRKCYYENLSQSLSHHNQCCVRYFLKSLKGSFSRELKPDNYK